MIIAAMRIFAILQLCIVFSIICWTLGRPFNEELYNTRTLRAAFRTVLGDQNLGNEFPDEKEKISQYHQLFTLLPANQQQQINAAYSQLQEQVSAGFWVKTKKALSLLFFELPAFERAWIFFSLILAVMALKQKQGVQQAIWLLPILTICYAIDQSSAATQKTPTAMENLVPNEKELTDQYLGHPIAGNIEEQKEQLRSIWEKYLVDVWSPKIKSNISTPLIRGEYAFSIARLEALQQDLNAENIGKSPPDSSMTLAVYIFWNLLFAISVSRASTPLCNHPHLPVHKQES